MTYQLSRAEFSAASSVYAGRRPDGLPAGVATRFDADPNGT